MHLHRAARHHEAGVDLRRGRRRPLTTRLPALGAIAAAVVCSAVTGCGSAPGDPDTAASPSLAGEQISETLVTAGVMTRSDAEFLGVEWEELRSAAGSLPWQLVGAAGVRMAAACSGSGSPTVVYLNGFGAEAADSWAIPAVEQSARNRVCLFDRPGVGLSEARTGPAPHTSTPQMHADEMFALMDILGEDGPFLLVAHSYGGLVARTAATADPADVAGMVLVDASSPLAPLGEPWPGEGGLIDVSAVPGAVGGGPDMGGAPVVVLRAGVWNEFSPLAVGESQWEGFQRQAATISSNSVYAVVTASDHWIPMRAPDAVVAATTAVSQSVRDGNTALGRCPAGLADAGADCEPL